jgi:hypothetical protein
LASSVKWPARSDTSSADAPFTRGTQAGLPDEHALAALLLGAEQAAHEQLGAPPWESVDALREPSLAATKAALGAAEWAAAVADGRALRPEEGAARARGPRRGAMLRRDPFEGRREERA